MRKLTTIILILLITSPVFGFGKEAQDQVLTKYLKSLYSNNLKKTYSYLSKADKNTISRIEFIKQNRLGDSFTQEIAKTVSSLRKYKINETIINGYMIIDGIMLSVSRLISIAPNSGWAYADSSIRLNSYFITGVKGGKVSMISLIR